MYKTLIASMVDVYAQATPLEGLPPAKAVPVFIHSFVSEFVKVNNLTKVADCADSFHNDFGDVETAINDLKTGDIQGAIAALTAWVATV